MLAQNFMTAKELDLDDKQYAALVGVLGMLERGEVAWTDYRWKDGREPKGLSFNMSDFEYGHRCGSVCCIAGLADKMFGTDFADESHNWKDEDPRDHLFFLNGPNDWNSDGRFCMHYVKVEHAAQALRNYLTTGAPKWAEVLA